MLNLMGFFFLSIARTISNHQIKCNNSRGGGRTRYFISDDVKNISHFNTVNISLDEII